LERIGKVLLRRGYDFTPGELEAAYDLQGARVREAWGENRDVRPEEQISLLLQGLRLDGGDSLRFDLETCYGEALLERPPQLSEGALPTLRGLWEGGMKVGLISNTGRIWGKFLRVVMRDSGILGCFHHLTFSDEVGLRKPHPEVFLGTLGPLRVGPSEAVHLGDDPDADVAGARGVGMKAILYVGGGNRPLDLPGDGVLESLRELPEILEDLP
jgi:putative hydrolase of the HAD superfamily